MSSLTTHLQKALDVAQDARPPVNGFPHFAEALRQAGISRIETSIATGGSIYHLHDAAVVQQFPAPAQSMAEIPNWDEPALITAIRADQAGRSTFPDFLRGAWDAGVIGFTVDLTARTCTYRGTTDSYLEHYTRP